MMCLRETVRYFSSSLSGLAAKSGWLPVLSERRRAWRLCSAAYSRPIIPGDRLIHSGLHYFKFHSFADPYSRDAEMAEKLASQCVIRSTGGFGQAINESRSGYNLVKRIQMLRTC